MIPYQPNRPAGADVFVGRSELLQMATSGLKIGGICYSIIGKSGMGKTSLLNAIFRSLVAYPQQISSGAIPLPIYIECQRSHQRLTNLLETILQKAVEALSIQKKLDCPKTLLERSQIFVTQSQNLIKILNPLLDWVFDQKNCNYLPILIFDDLHRLCQTGVIGELASLCQTAVNQQHIALVLAGRDALTEELRNDVSPLRLLITHNYELGPLSLVETEILVKKAETLGWFVEKAFSNHIYQITKGHPYRLHYYLHGTLLNQDNLTVHGLNSLYTPENVRYLEQILSDSGTKSRKNEAFLSQEEIKEIRSYIREDKLEKALKYLLDLEQYQRNADLLYLQFSHLEQHRRKGTLSYSEINSEYIRIADQILKLIQ